MYRLTDEHAFVIENYQHAHPFSSFLPGLAGKEGIPLWAFYVNRGQVMSSFGIHNKDFAITEFFPADKAYQTVPVQGFRTFIRGGKEKNNSLFEPFSFMKDNDSVKETLTISTNHIQLDYYNDERGLTLKIEYYALPNEPIAALVREVTLKNVSGQELDIEMVDGLASIFPSGVENAAYKELGNTLKSWFDVETLDDHVNYYYLRGSTEDEADVSDVNNGNFYASLAVLNDKEQLIKPIYDRSLVFGDDLTLQHPAGLDKTDFSKLHDKQQVSTNKVSSGFTPIQTKLPSNDSIKLFTVIGHTENREAVSSFISENFNGEKLAGYKKAAKSISEQLTDVVKTETSEALFDAYVTQNYLDNGLRGGFPTVFENKDDYKIFYLYSRKHGDLERDYNFFSISPTYYSQGNGNYRDVNQNRRLDVLFQPKVQDSNLQQFVNLLQLDGYNPLAVKEVQFTLDSATFDFSKYNLLETDIEKLVLFFNKPFAPGDVLKFVEKENIDLSLPFEEFLTDILMDSDESLKAEHGEGFWVDHWTYNLDLLDSYLAVYPDQEQSLFFGKSYRFFDSPASVNTRDTKYVDNDGVLRQYHAVKVNEDKLKMQQDTGEQWLRSDYGKGAIYETNLYSKLFLLAANKTATIAPFGLGIEMEAGKPGWNDALNGLPGMFGASTSELYELKRLIKQLRDVTNNDIGILLPKEAEVLITGLAKYISQHPSQNELAYWKDVTGLRETYRSKIHYGISGESVQIDSNELLRIFGERVDSALASVETYTNQDLVPTYFYFEAEVNEHDKSDILNFKAHAVTPFLEGVVKKLKLSETPEEAEKTYQAVRKSDIYDEKLGMYKTSTPIANEPYELGRAKSFTPGWLENESYSCIWNTSTY